MFWSKNVIVYGMFLSKNLLCSILLQSFVLLSFIFLGACSHTSDLEFEQIHTEIDLMLDPSQISQDYSSWYSQIKSEALDQLINEGLRNNWDLASSSAKVRISKARFIQFGGYDKPQFSGSIASSKGKTNAVFSEISPSSRTTENHQLSLDLMWEIDLWDRLSTLEEAYENYWFANQLDLEAIKLSLSGNISKTWFQFLTAEKKVALAVANYRNVLKSTKQIEELYNSGLKSSLDVRLSKSNLASFEVQIPESKRIRDQFARELEFWIGRYPKNSILLTGTLPIIKDALPSSIPSSLLLSRPDIIAAQKRLLSSNNFLIASKKELLPKLSFVGNTGTSSNEFKDLLNSNLSVWNLAGNLTQPIFQGKRLIQEVEIQKAKLEDQMALYKKKVLQVFLEVENLLSNRKYYQSIYKASKNKVEESTAAEKIAWERYQKGLIDFTSYLSTEQSKFNAENHLLDAHYQLIENFINLHIALALPVKLDHSTK